MRQYEISYYLKMAHSGGFEPPTARFVAEYSIQLSYECITNESNELDVRQSALKQRANTRDLFPYRQALTLDDRII